MMEENSKTKNPSFVDESEYSSLKSYVWKASRGIPIAVNELVRMGFPIDDIPKITNTGELSKYLQVLAQKELEDMNILYKGTERERRIDIGRESKTDWDLAYRQGLRYFKDLWDYWSCDVLRFTDGARCEVDIAASEAVAREKSVKRVDGKSLSDAVDTLKELQTVAKKLCDLGLKDILTSYVGLTYRSDSGGMRSFNMENLLSGDADKLDNISFVLLRSRYIIE